MSHDVFDSSVADVDKFYQQCDPGEFSVRGIRVLVSTSLILFSVFMELCFTGLVFYVKCGF